MQRSDPRRVVWKSLHAGQAAVVVARYEMAFFVAVLQHSLKPVGGLPDEALAASAWPLDAVA